MLCEYSWVPVWGRGAGFKGKGGATGVIGVNATTKEGGATVAVRYAGAPRENVTLTFAALGGAGGACAGGAPLKTVALSCVVGASGTVQFALPEMACWA